MFYLIRLLIRIYIEYEREILILIRSENEQGGRGGAPIFSHANLYPRTAPLITNLIIVHDFSLRLWLPLIKEQYYDR